MSPKNASTTEVPRNSRLRFSRSSREIAKMHSEQRDYSSTRIRSEVSGFSRFWNGESSPTSSTWRTDSRQLRQLPRRLSERSQWRFIGRVALQARHAYRQLVGMRVICILIDDGRWKSAFSTGRAEVWQYRLQWQRPELITKFRSSR